MDDLIRRQDAIRAVTTRDGCGRCEKVIKSIPSEQKKGHWVTTKSIDNEYFQMCDVCQRMASVRTNFCPHCGADMRGDGDV